MFSLGYKVRWPLSIVISKRSITKYQLIFRHLFHCKHVRAAVWSDVSFRLAVNALVLDHRCVVRSSVSCALPG